jgi:hypothetical protein
VLRFRLRKPSVLSFFSISLMLTHLLSVMLSVRPMFVWYWRELHTSCNTCVQSYCIYLTINRFKSIDGYSNTVDGHSITMDPSVNCLLFLMNVCTAFDNKMFWAWSFWESPNTKYVLISLRKLWWCKKLKRTIFQYCRWTFNYNGWTFQYSIWTF